ncbi:hypothetical protein A5630_15500 [Mycolicibacterium mucogenicum]|uniref:Major facilitator superfamily (MFS) profile domain-containing protein n=1 Tax=Mycolicibacterium mucogenicum TaxID=56689 RepID=A0A1A3H9U9_MYCMU|nr:hypothetical protein A5630_15500 [Mycolicibacterium mucogenicum]
MASVVGSYGALAQLAQIVGSWMADRVIAPRVLVLFGGCLIAAGHIALGILPDFVGLFVGLGLVVVGTGAFKTNLSRLMGIIYDDNPEWEIRRDAGFTIYLAATNTGVVIGPFLAGIFQSTWGFHAGFAVAAAGMFLGLAQYAAVYKKLPAASSILVHPLQRSEIGKVIGAVVLAALAAAGLYFLGALDGETLSTTIGVVVVAVIALYYAVMFASPEVTAAEKTRLRGLLPISLAGLIFWGFSFQIFTTVPLFVTSHVDLWVGGWRVPELWFASIIAIGSIFLSLLASILWNRLGERQPSAAAKIVIAFALTAIGFLSWGLAAAFSTKVPALVLLVCLFVIGASEAFIGPLVLSLGTKCMPRKFRAQGLAVMVLSIGGGSVLAGIWGTIYTAMTPSNFLYLVAAVAAGCAIILASVAGRTLTLITTFD